MELILMDAQLKTIVIQSLLSSPRTSQRTPEKKNTKQNEHRLFSALHKISSKISRDFQTAFLAVSQAIDFTVSLRVQNMAVVGKVSDSFGERRRGRK